MALSEHVYCLAIIFQMNEQLEQWICIKFCVMLEHSSMETIHMIQKATATGNWWLTASSWQCTHTCIMSSEEFFGKISSHPGDSDPMQPTLGVLWLLAFPKIKITFEREKILGHQWDSGKYDRAADGDWENCVRSRGAYSEGDWGVIVLWTMDRKNVKTRRLGERLNLSFVSFNKEKLWWFMNKIETY